MPTVLLETHCHTCYSPDSLTSPADLLTACRRRGIDRIVITDHNTIEGALRAKELMPDMVIVGEEIKTQQGELLAFFVEEEVPRELHAFDAIDRLRAQRAFISVSHPFDVTRSGHWSLEDLLSIAPWVDAIEVFNARCFSARFDERAAAFAAQQGLAGTAGSDAHSVIELGRGKMELPAFHDIVSFREAIPQAVLHMQRSRPWVRLISRYAIMRRVFSQ